MSVIKMAFLGVIVAVMASFLRQYKPEFSLYLMICTCFLFFSIILGDLAGLSQVYAEVEESLGEYREFLGILMKVIGITYLCELCGGICKDSGYSTLAQQVELCGKISIFLLGMPILMMLLQEIRGFLI